MERLFWLSDPTATVPPSRYTVVLHSVALRFPGLGKKCATLPGICRAIVIFHYLSSKLHTMQRLGFRHTCDPKDVCKSAEERETLFFKSAAKSPQNDTFLGVPLLWTTIVWTLGSSDMIECF